MLDANMRKILLAYRNMRTRCENPSSKAYPNYGGRGIFVCQEWRDSRESFVQWALSSGHSIGLSIDRIDVNGEYSPENCRWVTDKQQLRNQRRNVLLTHNGVTMCMSEWAEKIGVNSDTLHRRIKVYKMPIEKALTPGRIQQWKHGTRHAYEFYKCKCDECRMANTIRHRYRRERIAESQKYAADIAK